jgi:tetratricopeptide (TPR) repeat protein
MFRALSVLCHGCVANNSRHKNRFLNLIHSVGLLVLVTAASCSKKSLVERIDAAYDRADAAFLNGQYDEAERWALKSATETVKHLPHDKSRITEGFELAGMSASKRRDHEKAFQHYQAGIAHLDPKANPVEWARISFSLAFTLIDQDDYSGAETIQRQVVAVFTEHFGSNDLETVSARIHLANTWKVQGHYEKAEAEQRKGLALREQLLGPDDLDTVLARLGLAATLMAQDKYVEARGEQQAALNVLERTVGSAHRESVSAKMGLADALQGQELYAQAEVHYRDLLKIPESARDSKTRLWSLIPLRLAVCLQKQGKLDEARIFARRAVEEIPKTYGASDPLTKHAENLYRELNPPPVQPLEAARY